MREITENDNLENLFLPALLAERSLCGQSHDLGKLLVGEAVGISGIVAAESLLRRVASSEDRMGLGSYS